jgi:predicted ATP-grasp superfamily ATP-dependent carboligase
MLSTHHFVELEPQQQVQVLRYLCDQHFDNEHVLEVYDEHQESLAQLRKDKVWWSNLAQSTYQALRNVLTSIAHCSLASSHQAEGRSAP